MARLTIFVQLLRDSAAILSGIEDSVFKSINHEEWVQRAAALERWCFTNSDHLTLRALREAVELKKLNGGYMKSTLIDDLIADSYARLYQQIAAELPIVNKDSEGAAAKSENKDTSNAEPAPKARAKGVGRRELLKTAEAAGASIAPVTPQAQALRQGSVSERDAGEATKQVSGNTSAANKPQSVSDHESTQAEAGKGSEDQANTAPQSILDDADDESELSDIEEPEDMSGVESQLAASREARRESSGSSQTIYHEAAEEMEDIVGDEERDEGEEAGEGDGEEDGAEEEESGVDEDVVMLDGAEGDEGAENEKVIAETASEREEEAES